MLGRAFVESEAFNLSLPDYGLILLKTIFALSTMTSTQFPGNSLLSVVHNKLHSNVWIRAEVCKTACKSQQQALLLHLCRGK